MDRGSLLKRGGVFSVDGIRKAGNVKANLIAELNGRKSRSR